MGLMISLYRSTYDSPANYFHGATHVVVVNVPGPFEPSDLVPAARLERGPVGQPVLVPAEAPAGMIGPMDGGTLATTTDSRWSEAMLRMTGLATYPAVPVHDRFETPAQAAAQG